MPLREVFSNRKATVRERTEALVHFLEALEMEQKLAAMAQQFEEVGDMSLAKEYGQVYGLVMDLFDRIVALLGEEVMGQREYAEILDAGFAEIKVGLIPAVVDRIVVGDITRTRLSNIKVLFFAGVNDGIVPSVSGRGGILSEADRRALREMQVELAPTARECFAAILSLSGADKAVGLSLSVVCGVLCRGKSDASFESDAAAA